MNLQMLILSTKKFCSSSKDHVYFTLLNNHS